MPKSFQKTVESLTPNKVKKFLKAHPRMQFERMDPDKCLIAKVVRSAGFRSASVGGDTVNKTADDGIEVSLPVAINTIRQNFDSLMGDAVSTGRHLLAIWDDLIA